MTAYQRVLQMLGIAFLFILALACAWILAVGEWYELPWFDVDLLNVVP